jgi:serine acetyltransferase
VARLGLNAPMDSYRGAGEKLTVAAAPPRCTALSLIYLKTTLIGRCDSHLVVKKFLVNPARGRCFVTSRQVFAVDIRPAVPIGEACFIHHGTSLVVGETAIIGNDISILHEVMSPVLSADLRDSLIRPEGFPDGSI